MSLIWNHSYKAMNVSMENSSLLLIDSICNSISDRETAVELLFEKHLVSKTVFLYSPIATLYSSGRTTGMIVDCGYINTSICAVYEGCGIPSSISRAFIGGRDVYRFLPENNIGQFSLKSYMFLI